jgi:hypothetical protein
MENLKNSSYEVLLEGLTMVLIDFALGEKTDLTRAGVEELEFIMDRTGPSNVMLRFYDHLNEGHGYEATHMKYDTFCEIFPDTAKLLTIFVYS